jgi:hypothetical protein
MLRRVIIRVPFETRSRWISGQALELLCVLLEQPSELITREQIEHRLWPDRTEGLSVHRTCDDAERESGGERGAPVAAPVRHVRGHRHSGSDCGDRLCSHAVRPVCSAATPATVTGRARPVTPL